MGLVFDPFTLVIVTIFIDHVPHPVAAIFLPAANIVESQLINHGTISISILRILSTYISSLSFDLSC